MSLYEKLSLNDKNMMNEYISEYVSYSHASLEYLLRYWNDAKADLYKMFGENFRLTKPIEWAKPKSKIISEFYNLFNRSNSYCFRFRKIFDRFLWENRETLGGQYYMLQLMMDMDNLATSVYNGDEFSVMTPQGKEIKVQKGCRPMRMISRVSKAYGGIELLDEFQTEISQVLNQKKLTGNLTISIHPMDFMTMSDNDSDWSSCMSWREEGCYRRGTVEMMNSNNVIVAYLASDDDMTTPGGYTWNNKKWRELFVVTPEVISGVKGYPYQNEELVQIVNLWLKELAEKNLNWYYEKNNTVYQHRTTFDHIDEETGEVHEAYLRFHTYTMYNDFGSIDEHYCIFGKDLDDYNLDITYSGQEICMGCGSSSEEFDGEGALLCCSCDNPTYCRDCGDRINEDDAYWLDDEPFCEYCYNEHAREDDLSGEEHDKDNMYKVYFLEPGVEPCGQAFRDAPYIRTINVSSWNRNWSRYFNADAKYVSINWNGYYYVTPDMFNDTDNIEDLFDIVYEVNN